MNGTSWFYSADGHGTLCVMAVHSLPTPPPPPDGSQLVVMAPLCAIFRRYLRTQNLKYTPERADILDAIIECDDVFEVDQLLMEMRRRGHHVSKATIYRTVKLLQDAGIITQALFDSKQAHYQLIYGKAARDYIVCMKTGEYIEFSDEELVALRNRICEKHGWDPVGHRFQIYAISPAGRRLIDPVVPRST